jgi:dTDP-4-dehydrorhamnose reductase
MRILVVGAAGHLGSAVAHHLAPSADVTATTRADLDVRDHRAVEATVTRVSPDVVINCSAYTDVDRAEDEPNEALEVNAFAVKGLAVAARAIGAAFVHYSTDFVFDGTADRPYTEDDEPNPRSAYACSKLIGEWFAREAGRHYVLRVESVFGSLAPSSSPRRTSVDRILDAILEGREARVFVDRTVSPSYSADVARATRELLERRAPEGLYHCVSSGSCTWEALAREAARQLNVEPRLAPVRMADARLRADRPRYCALANTKLAGVGVAMPSWQDALARYLRERDAPVARP